MNNNNEQVFKKYSSAIKGFITKRVSSLVDAEDILHDVFYRFIVTQEQGQVIENVSSWLYRVTRNRISDFYKKHREQEMPYLRPNDEESLVSLGELVLTDDDSPESVLFAAIISEQIQQAIETLPEEQRVVYELNELQGISFKDISKATGINVNTLISRKRYAVESLQKQLKGLYSVLRS